MRSSAPDRNKYGGRCCDLTGQPECGLGEFDWLGTARSRARTHEWTLYWYSYTKYLPVTCYFLLIQLKKYEITQYKQCEKNKSYPFLQTNKSKFFVIVKVDLVHIFKLIDLPASDEAF